MNEKMNGDLMVQKMIENYEKKSNIKMEKTVYVLTEDGEVRKAYEDSDVAYKAAIDLLIEQYGIATLVDALDNYGIHVQECEYVEEETI